MRSQYPNEKVHMIIADLVKDRFIPEYPIEEKLENYLTSKATGNSSLFFIPLVLTNKSPGKLALSKDPKGISVSIIASNPTTGISYHHDPKHFPITPDCNQLNNYLNGSAIFLQRLNKVGEMGEYFIQAIPDNYNRAKITHLQLHPKQTYLMVSNNYLKLAPDSDSFKVGGRTLNEQECLKIKSGFPINMINPWFFIKETGKNNLEKIKAFGQFSFSIDLLKKSYKNIVPLKPVIEPEFLGRSILHFVSQMKNLIGSTKFESFVSDAMEQAPFKQKNDWTYLFNHILYAANATYSKSGEKNNRYEYPYKSGYDITTIQQSESIVLHPKGTSEESQSKIVLTDPIAILDKLKDSQQISDTVYQFTLDQIVDKKDQSIKL